MNRKFTPNMARTTARTFLAFLALPLLGAIPAACGSDASAEQQRETGSLTIIAKTSSAVSLDTLTVKVTLTPSGGGADIPLTLTLLSDVGHGSWTGTFADVPKGDYTLHGEATDANGVVIYSTTAVNGTDPPVTVDNSDQAIAVMLQEVNGDSHDFSNTVPRVISLADTGSIKVRPGEKRSFEFIVEDPDTVAPGTDVLTFTSVATSGAPTAGTTDSAGLPAGTIRFSFDWTAPLTPPVGVTGPYQVDVGASAVDRHGAQVGLTMTLTVGNPQSVEVSVNSWPVFNDNPDDGYGITVPGPFLPMNTETNPSTTLTSSAEDPDGDALTYAWSADAACAPFVAFKSPEGSSTTFTITSEPQGIDWCTVTLTVNDGHGGTNTGKLTIPFGADPDTTSNEGPVCGDGTCDPGETYQTCARDCG